MAQQNRSNEWVSDSFLQKAQALSGLVFGAYASVHLINALSANFGPAAYDAVLQTVRPYYQNPVVEPVVLGALAGHITASTARFFRRRARQAALAEAHVDQAEAKESALARVWRHLGEPLYVHRYAGYFLVSVIGGHVAATRLAPALVGSKADFAFLSFAIKEVSPWIFYPYYVMLPMAGLYHGMYGARQAISVWFPKVKLPSWTSPRSWVFKSVLALGLAGFIGAVLVFGKQSLPNTAARFAQLRIDIESLTPDSFRFLLPWAK